MQLSLCRVTGAQSAACVDGRGTPQEGDAQLRRRREAAWAAAARQEAPRLARRLREAAAGAGRTRQGRVGRRRRRGRRGRRGP